MIDKIFELITYFMIYSFLGWVMESTFRSISEKKVINTGFLIGPYCPIYGIGAIIMFLFLDSFETNLILLFFISIIVLSAWEYIVGYFLEKIFNTKYWDYSDHKLNIKGRICLTNSIYWGFLGVVFIKYIHPFTQNLISKVDINLLKYIVSILFMVFLVDVVVSIIKVKNIRTTLEKIEKLNNEIKEKLNEIRMLRKQKEKALIIQNIQQLVKNLKKKRSTTIIHLYRNVYRLKKAFPAIDTKEITEVLNNKIQIIKQKHKTLKKKK